MGEIFSKNRHYFWKKGNETIKFHIFLNIFQKLQLLVCEYHTEQKYMCRICPVDIRYKVYSHIHYYKLAYSYTSEKGNYIILHPVINNQYIISGRQLSLP